MKDIEVYGKLIKEFVRTMTSPEIGQFKLETSTFRIILERARVQKPVLIKFTLTEDGKIVNNLSDDDESLDALRTLMKRAMDFISSLIGEELARDIIMKSLRNGLRDMMEDLKGRERLLGYIPQPFITLINDMMEDEGEGSNHDELLEVFEEVFQVYLKELASHTDLSAFKLKLSILREDHQLLRHLTIKKNNNLHFDKGKWSRASDGEVRNALVAAFNSMVGLSTFLVGKEEALKKATRTFEYYFEGSEGLLDRYDLKENILEGALHQNISTGIPSLDEKMEGGIPKGSSILFISPSGIERDIFIQSLLTKGLENGSSVLMVLSKEPPRSIRMMLRSKNQDPKELEESGRLRIVDWFSWRGERIIGVEKDGHALKSSKILSNLGIAINKGLRDLSYSTNKIAMVHIIGPATNIFEFTQVYNFVQRLRAKFKEEEMASIFLLETETLSGELRSRIIEVFDGTIEMSKTMEGGSFRRELSILNLSGVDYDARPVPFEIRENRIMTSSEIEKIEKEKLEKVTKPAPRSRHIELGPSSIESDGKGPTIKDLLIEDISKDGSVEELDKLELSDEEVQGVEKDLKGAASEGTEEIELEESVSEEGEPVVQEETFDEEMTSETEPVKKVFKRKIKRKMAAKKKPMKIGTPRPLDLEHQEKKIELGPSPYDEKVVPLRKVKVRRVRRKSNGKGSMKEKELEGAPENILLEAISTIDELLEGSERALVKGSEMKPKQIRRRIEK